MSTPQSTPDTLVDVETLLQRETPKLLNCVHCGICLDQCPTYRMSGDESNSPRGRLAIWRALDEGRLEPSPTTDYYTDECVGCLACESICPAQVPYGELLVQARDAQQHRQPSADRRIAMVAGWLVRAPRLFSVAAAPLRWLRRLGWLRHRHVAPGKAPVFTSTARYAERVNACLKPQGETVALLTGCLMDAVYREINFATIRVLALNGVRVVVPEGQGCCGALHEHAGLPGRDVLNARNVAAFDECENIACVATNAAGCGLALSHTLSTPVRDALSLLNALPALRQGQAGDTAHIYYDIPCHLYHGMGETGAPAAVLDAIGNDWSLAPNTQHCCGSGGTYTVTHEANAMTILREKAQFLNDDLRRDITLATANHVCLMQWHAGRHTGVIRPDVRMAHLLCLLDESYARACLYPPGLR